MHFYVYEHWRPDLGACFYVGKGHGRRAWRMSHRTKHHQAIQKSLSAAGMAVEVRIVAADLAEDTALALEIERIAFYGRAALINLTAGGDGRGGYVVSEATRQKIAAKLRGQPFSDERRANISKGLTGRKMSPEACANMSKARKGVKTGRPLNPKLREAFNRKGKKMPEEARRKISLALTKRVRKPVSEESRKRMSISAKAFFARRNIEAIPCH